MADDGIFEQYGVASWTVGDRDTIKFPVRRITETIGNRLVRRARPYRKGEKIDSTGTKARGWVVEVEFENSIEEPGLPTAPALYPTVLNAMLASAEDQETGDLVLPTRGALRCRLEMATRIETSEDRDYALVTFTWWEDNEDDVDAAALANPTVRATARVLAERTVDTAQSFGADNDFLGQLEDFAFSLETALAAPGNRIQEVEVAGRRLSRTAGAIGQSFSRTGEAGRDILTDPSSHGVMRSIRRLQDRAATAADEKMKAKPRTVSAVFQVNHSIYDIAVALGQNAQDLLELNSTRIDDPLFIEAGTVILVFER